MNSPLDGSTMTMQREVDAPGAAVQRSSFSDLSQRYAGVAVAVGLFVLFAILRTDQFLTYDFIVSIIANGAITGLIALGLLFPLSAGVFDLSVAGVMTISVVGVTWLFQVTSGGMPIIGALVIVLAASGFIGLVNSFFILKLQIDPFITTIGTSSILLGLSQLIADGATITADIPEAFTNLGRSAPLKIPISVYVFIVLAAVAWYVLEYTPFGRKLYATGASREASRLAGVNTQRIVASAMIASALGAAVAGIVLAARLGSGPPDTGSNYLLASYSAAFLGSTIIVPGRFNVLGLVVAVLILNIGINGFLLIGTPFWVVPLFEGTALLVAVTLGRVMRRQGRAASTASR